jgi:hypothetical protein
VKSFPKEVMKVDPIDEAEMSRIIAVSNEKLGETTSVLSQCSACELDRHVVFWISISG